MQHYLFCDKNCVNFGIKLDAEISIWMQSGFDGFDFSATLMTKFQQNDTQAEQNILIGNY